MTKKITSSRAQAVAEAENHASATADYVKQMAYQLAELASLAGYARLSEILTLAAHEAQLCRLTVAGMPSKLHGRLYALSQCHTD
jgi:hypothetical protein